MLLYEHDSNGTPIGDGNKKALLDHIKSGGGVRISFYDQAQDRTTLLTPIAVFTRYEDVFAQVAYLVSDWVEPDHDLLKFYEPASTYSLNISTSGSAQRRVTDSSGRGAVDSLRLAARWFAA